MQFADDMQGVATAPFAQELDVVHLFLLVGIVMVCIIAWGFILNHVKMAATEILT